MNIRIRIRNGDSPEVALRRVLHVVDNGTHMNDRGEESYDPFTCTGGYAVIAAPNRDGGHSFYIVDVNMDGADQ